MEGELEAEETSNMGYMDTILFTYMVLHGFRAGHGTGTNSLESKLIQQLKGGGPGGASLQIGTVGGDPPYGLGPGGFPEQGG